MKILATGGAGYIGSHSCVAFLQAGHEVIIADNYNNSSPEAVKRVEQITGKTVKVYEGDVCDKEFLRKIFRENDIDVAVHYAGYKAVGESARKPLEYYDNNLNSTLSLLYVMREFKVKRVVFSSSATVYGTVKEMPLTENSPIGAINPYGRTKLFIEEIMRDLYASDNEWSIALLRYFNPIGAHESGLIGEDPKGIPNNLMPYIAQVAVGKLERLNVFGNDYNTPDGTGVRDYIHVMDLGQGHEKAVEYVMNNTGCEAINLGTGRGYSVLELKDAFERASGITIPFKIVERRPGDTDEVYADPKKAEKLLGWKAEKTVDEMCADTWRWQKNNPNGYN